MSPRYQLALAVSVAAVSCVVLFGCDFIESSGREEPTEPPPPPVPAHPSASRVDPADRLETARQGIARLSRTLRLDAPAIDVEALRERYPDGWTAFAWQDRILDHVQLQGERFYLLADRARATLEAEAGLFLQLSVYDGLYRTQLEQTLVRVDFPETGRGTRPVPLQGTHEIGVDVLVAGADRALLVVGIGPATR